MVRRLLLSSALVLLASCAQDSDPVPDTPTTVSTDFADAATHITTDARGDAYVLGYRNKHVDTGVNSSGAATPADLFVSRFDPSGTVRWLTVLRSDGVDESSLRGLATTSAAVYALTQNGMGGPLHLHNLSFDGTLRWSKVIVDAPSAVSGFSAAPDGQLYVQYSVASGADAYSRYVSALDAEGDVQWSKALPGEFLGTGGDNSFYAVDALKLQKYSVGGTLRWSRDIAPSIPYVTEPTAAPSVSLQVREDALYVLVNFFQNVSDASRGDVSNTEVSFLTADGAEVWSRLLYPAETGSPANRYDLFPAGITPDADLYLVASTTFDYPGAVSRRSQQLHRFFADGQRTSAALDAYGNGIAAAALAPEQVTDSLGLSLTTFYMVGTAGKDLAGCINYMEPSEPCIYTDTVTSLYTVDSASDRNDLYVHLQWSSR